MLNIWLPPAALIAFKVTYTNVLKFPPKTFLKTVHCTIVLKQCPGVFRLAKKKKKKKIESTNFDMIVNFQRCSTGEVLQPKYLPFVLCKTQIIILFRFSRNFKGVRTYSVDILPLLRIGYLNSWRYSGKDQRFRKYLIVTNFRGT